MYLYIPFAIYIYAIYIHNWPLCFFFFQLEVAVRIGSMLDVVTKETHSAYEYERLQPVIGWGSDYPGHLLPSDPGRYTDECCLYYVLTLNTCYPSDCLPLSVCFSLGQMERRRDQSIRTLYR